MVAPPAPQPSPSGPGRYRRVLGNLSAAVGLSVVFAGALVFSVVVHLDMAPTRRVARTIANQILGGLFKGTVVVGEIDRLSLRGITVKSATAFDPRGAEVARIDGLRADTNVIAIVRSVLFGKGHLRVPVPLVHLDRVDVALDRGPNGVPGIAETFLMKNPGPPPRPDAIPPLVTLDRIEIDHIVAHGAIAPPTSIDAELARVVGTVRVDREGVLVGVAPAQIDARAPLPQPLSGLAGFRLQVLPVKPGAAPIPPRMEVSFDGKIGEIDVSAGAEMAGPYVKANAAVKRATPQAISAFVPDKSVKLPLKVPVSATVAAEGNLPELALDVHVLFEGTGGVDAKGKLSLDAPPGLDLDFAVNKLDPSIVIEMPKASPLDAKGRVHLGLGPELAIDAGVTTEPLTVAGQPIPRVEATAALAKGVWRGGAKVDEVGAPTTATFSFDKAEGLRFEVDSRVGSLRAVKRLAVPVDGSVRVKVAGSLRDGELDAKVSGRVGNVRAPGGVSLDDGTIEARVRGKAEAPTIEASVNGSGLRAGPYAFEKIDAHASGSIGALRVDTKLDAGAGESIAASGALDTAAKALRDVKLDVKRRQGEIVGTVARVAAAPGGVVVDGLALHGEGVGGLTGGLTVQGKELVGKLRGHDVDLAKVMKMVGLPARVGGLANIDVDLRSSRPGSRTGHVAIELVDGEAAGVSGLSALLSARFEGERMRLDGLARLIARATPREAPADRCDGAIATVRLDGGDGLLAGPLLDPATWERLSGKIEVGAEDLNLRCMARLVPMVDLVASEVRGKLTARATIQRRPGARLPSVRDLFARTRGLEVAGALSARDDKPEWESRSVDVEIKGSFDAASGVTGARIALDDGSTIASIGGRTTLDMTAFLDHPERRWDMLRVAPIHLSAAIPRRAVGAFGTLPSFVRAYLPPLAGDVKLNATIDGTIEKPRVEVRASGWGLAHVLSVEVEEKRGKGHKETVTRVVQRESPWGMPIDFDVFLGYDGQKAIASAHVKHEEQTIADAEGEIAAPLADLLAKKPIKPKGRLEAKLTRVPLAEIPFFADRGIQGQLNGTLELHDIGGAPTLKAAFDLPGLKLGPDLAYDQALVQLDITRRRESPADRGSATARFEMSSKTGGKMSASAFSEIVWQNGVVPTIDPTRPADLVAKANHFRIAALGPFLAGVLSRVDGTLDADARVGFTRLDDDDKARIAVRLKLTGGVFHVPQLGQELHDAEIEVSGGGGGIVKLEKLRADGTKGRITGSGTARFAGLRFQRADASFKIKQGEELPITLEGVPFGDARGEVTITAEKHNKDLAVTIGIPHLHIDLPASTGRGVQELDENPDVVVEQERLYAPEPRPKDGSRLKLTFNLGNISVKSNIIDVALSGVKNAPLTVEVADKARITGDIQLTRGRLEILKKQFQIEQGVIHMRPEDPGNPYVNVTARWDSPEGDPIYIEYAGVLLPIAPEKIKYHSPKIPDDKIISTLLFGGMEQATLGGSGGQGGPGVPGQGLAAQLIAQQFSTQIAGNISTSIGTNDDGTFRPGLRYNSGDKVIELSTYGASGATAAAGAAAPKGQRTQITVDWRFWRNWLLRGRVDAGSDQTTTGVDVLWQYRY